MTGLDLIRNDGSEIVIAQDIFSAIGLEMIKWRMVKRFTAWLGRQVTPPHCLTGRDVS